ncbi:hypothetical protein, partial [Ursidibacter maritimus]|uniref:hypothetical protein n=3 Tax=Ursidibacter maritimus TaxID=1331689 RepID=UPI001C437855
MISVEYAKCLFFVFTFLIFILCLDCKKCCKLLRELLRNFSLDQIKNLFSCNTKYLCVYLKNILALCLSVMLIPLSEIILNDSKVQNSDLGFIIRCLV